MQFLLNLALLFSTEIYVVYMNFYLAELNASHLAPLFWVVSACTIVALSSSNQMILTKLAKKKNGTSILFLLASTLSLILIGGATHLKIILFAVLFATIIIFAISLITSNNNENNIFNIILVGMFASVPLIILFVTNISTQALFNFASIIFILLGVITFWKPNIYKIKLHKKQTFKKSDINSFKFNFIIGILILSVYFYLMKTYGAGQFARALNHLSEMQMQAVYGLKTSLLMFFGIYMTISKFPKNIISKNDTLIITGSTLLLLKIYVYSVGSGVLTVIAVELLAAIGVFLIGLAIFNLTNTKQLKFNLMLFATWIGVIIWNILFFQINNEPQKIFEIATALCLVLMTFLFLDKIIFFTRRTKYVNRLKTRYRS